jgi:pimeloyl-ACP methyl ester carboxylesterase
MTAGTDAWEARGRRVELAGHPVFVVDLPPAGTVEHEALLVIHGFPTSSFDFHLVADRLAAHRRVVLLDLVGFGLSAKPDLAYTVDLQADVVVALTHHLGLARLSLLTHDFGDTVGGELLARHTEGRWPVEVVSRVLTNGSIYIGMAHLSDGQLLLLDLPDQKLPDDAPFTAETLAPGLAITFSPASTVPADELAGACELVLRSDGQLLLPRTIRYIEERRRREARFTGAIEDHPSPLAVVWGADDPIAVLRMTDRLVDARPGTPVTVLDGVGHFPMVEAPDRFLDAVVAGLH